MALGSVLTELVVSTNQSPGVPIRTVHTCMRTAAEEGEEQPVFGLLVHIIFKSS